MAIKVEQLSEQVFNLLKSRRFNMSLFKSDGSATVNIDEARRLYDKTENVMVFLDESAEILTMRVYIGKNFRLSEHRSLLFRLRDLAVKNVVGYELKKFKTELKPKDFVHELDKSEEEMNVSPVTESFSKPWGTVKTSRQRFENATMYIRHSKRVNEEIRGSRSRNIHSIFIENQLGERFKFGYNNIPAARAMTVHVNEGGTPYDEVGSVISEMAKEEKCLKEFVKYGRNNDIISESYSKILDETKNRIRELKETFGKLKSPSNYSKFVESLDDEPETQINEEIQMFEEFEELPDVIHEARPFLESVFRKCKKNQVHENYLKKAIGKVLEYNGLPIQQQIQETDVDHPSQFEYSSKLDEHRTWFDYFSKCSCDDELTEAMLYISENIQEFPKNLEETTTKLLTLLQNSSIMIEQEQENDQTELVTESFAQIKKSLEKYKFSKLFE